MKGSSASRPDGGRGFVYRGVTYDTGSGFSTGQGALSRNVWTPEQLNTEISLVSDGLNGNSITIYGSRLDRLREAATAAVERNLFVWLDPRLPDTGPDDVIDHLAEVALVAESLRQQGARIGLSTGATHTILTAGILAGNSYLERVARIYFDGDVRFGLRVGKPLPPEMTAELDESSGRLNEFLARAAGVARSIFKGRLTYGATPWETVDWSLFDDISLFYFLTPNYMNADGHLAKLATYDKWNKPVLITGYGTGSYPDAEKKGFFSFDIVDRSGAAPTVLDGYVRDESAQAAYYRKMLGIFEWAGVAGVASADLVHPTHPHSPEPRLDLDMASMCIVKSIRQNYPDPNSAYRLEKKESFNAIAEYYARSGDRQAVAS